MGGEGYTIAHGRPLMLGAYVNDWDPPPPHNPELEDAPHLPHLEGGARHRSRDSSPH